MGTLRDLTGQRFGRLVAIEITRKSKSGNMIWLFKCDCGKTKSIYGYDVVSGRTTSCGCYAKEMSLKSHLKNPGFASLNKKFKEYKQRQKNDKMDFELNIQKFALISRKNCHYCGSAPKPYNRYVKVDGTKAHSSVIAQNAIDRAWIYVNGIDRVNNDIGYVKDNCVPCCSTCNYMKRVMSKEEFLSHVQRIVDFQNKK